jgi:hypothetical protein
MVLRTDAVGTIKHIEKAKVRSLYILSFWRGYCTIHLLESFITLYFSDPLCCWFQAMWSHDCLHYVNRALRK